MANPLSESDAEYLRSVINDGAGGLRQSPAALRSPTVEHLGAGRIELRLRNSGPADAIATQIADQVLGSGWSEVSTGRAMERAFRSRP